MWFMLLHVCFFFFKQKTAYEMRISDWSSDVCSSDLRCAPTFAPHTPSQSVAADHHARAASGPRQHSLGRHHCPSSRFAALLLGRGACRARRDLCCTAAAYRPCALRGAGAPGKFTSHPAAGGTHSFYMTRSEEHTSELQSLMRTS